MSDPENSVGDGALWKAIGVVQAARAIAESDADMAIGYLRALGNGGLPLDSTDFLQAIANLRNAQFRMNGLYDHITSEASQIERLAQIEHVTPGSVTRRERVVASIGDLLNTRLLHFSPLASMTADECQTATNWLREGGAESLPEATTAHITPHTPQAQAWAMSVARGERSLIPTLPWVADARKDVVDVDDEATCPLEALRQKVWLTEVGAARLLSLTPKALGNRRRAERIPRELYDQNGAYGHVRYRVAPLSAFAERSSAAVRGRGRRRSMDP